MNYKLINGYCLEQMKKLKDNTIDSIVSDPPYGINFMNKKWDYDIPSVEIWKECLRVLKPGGHMLIACGTRTQHRMVCNIEDAGFEVRDIISWVYGSGFPKSLNIGKKLPEYNGFGTGLKPAQEFWTLVRKPISEKTIVDNVLKWGTGGINIDKSRIPFEDTKNAATNPKYRKENGYKLPEPGQSSNGAVNFVSSKNEINVEGRFPSNFIHDGSEEVMEIFEKVGISKGNKPGAIRKGIYNGDSFGTFKYENEECGRTGYNDIGNPSRFFYCAKVSTKERNMGMIEGKNIHSTLKPVKLMSYLCNLITPTNGIILDPFMGSGSTGIGALLNGFSFIGIELDSEYIKIAEQRIKSFELYREFLKNNNK